MSEEEKKALAKSVNSLVEKTLRWYLSGFVVLIGLMFGWHQVAINQNAKKIDRIEANIDAFENDFGRNSQVLYEWFPAHLTFQSNYNKYVANRGGKK